MGKWYEVARLPIHVQKDLGCCQFQFETSSETNDKDDYASQLGNFHNSFSVRLQ